MLKVEFGRKERNCAGLTRRHVLQVGSLGVGGLALPDLLAARASEKSPARKDTSVVWLWLNGGPTHIETFDPKMTAPSEFRSVTGEVKTVVPGVTLGGHFSGLARQSDKVIIDVTGDDPGVPDGMKVDIEGNEYNILMMFIKRRAPTH